jgi:hypothetical protein
VKFPIVPLLLTLLVALPIGRVCAEPNSGDLVRETVDRLGLQTELPRANSQQAGIPLNLQPGGEAPSSAPPRTAAPDSTVKPPDPGSTVNPPNQGSAPHTAPDDPPALLRYLLWVAVIIGILVVVWSLRNSLPVMDRSQKIVAPIESPPSLAQSQRMEEARLEADDLARQGHYREAMHLLLLQSLSELRRQLGTSFAISMTSREILRRVHLSDIGRQSLTAIIGSVEQTYFGAQDAGRDDYSVCRSHFEMLKQSLVTAARA